MKRWLLASALLVVLAVPSTAAAAKVRFAVTFSADVQLSWLDTTSNSGQCTVTAESTGSEHFRLTDLHRTILTVKTAHGRPTNLAGALALAVDASGGGSTTTSTCGQQTVAECTVGPPSFAASVRFARQKPGVLGLTGLSGNGFAPWKRCLPETFPTNDFPPVTRALGAVNERKLLKRSTTVVTAKDNRVTHVLTPGFEAGDLTRQVRWQLVFHRLGR